MENENVRLSALRDLQFHVLRLTVGRELDPADAIAERIALVTEEASDAA